MKDFMSIAELNPPAHHDFFKKENPERNSKVSIELFQKFLIHMSFEVLCCAVLQINLENLRILFWRSIMKSSNDDWMGCFADYQNGRSKPFTGDRVLKYYLHELKGRCSNNQNGNVRWIFQLGVGPPPPPPSLNGHCFQTFFNPHFSFAIESYIYEADFTLGQSKISLLSPLPIGSNIDILR